MQKDILLNLNAQSQQSAFGSTTRVFRTAYYVAKNCKPFTDFEKLIRFQEANSLRVGTKIKEIGSKITVLADESTRVGGKSALIAFLPATVDSKAAPISFALDLVELENLCASHIVDQTVDYLLKNGYSIESLQETCIGFCSDRE